MRIALSVLLTCWPPAPLARKVSMRRSAGFSVTSSASSGSGITATVQALVWMRPCDSVAGTRCTRWPPDSNAAGRRRWHRLRRAAPVPCSRPGRLAFLAQDLGAPALAFAEAQVHARQVAGEQRRFVAAGAGADLDEGVAGVVRVLRQQRGLQLGQQARHVGLGAAISSRAMARHRRLVGLGQHLLRGGEVALALLIAPNSATRAAPRPVHAPAAVALDVGWLTCGVGQVASSSVRRMARRCSCWRGRVSWGVPWAGQC
jgi:hypothetical protein